MKRNLSPSPSLPAPEFDERDVGDKTEALFQDICNSSGNERLRQTIGLINAQLHPIRPYECRFIPDRSAEFEAMSAAWIARDMSRLRELTKAYFKRRRDLIPQIIGPAQRVN